MSVSKKKGKLYPGAVKGIKRGTKCLKEEQPGGEDVDELLRELNIPVVEFHPPLPAVPPPHLAVCPPPLDFFPPPSYEVIPTPPQGQPPMSEEEKWNQVKAMPWGRARELDPQVVLAMCDQVAMLSLSFVE